MAQHLEPFEAGAATNIVAAYDARTDKAFRNLTETLDSRTGRYLVEPPMTPMATPNTPIVDTPPEPPTSSVKS